MTAVYSETVTLPAEQSYLNQILLSTTGYHVTDYQIDENETLVAGEVVGRLAADDYWVAYSDGVHEEAAILLVDVTTGVGERPFASLLREGVVDMAKLTGLPGTLLRGNYIPTTRILLETRTTMS